MFLLPSQKIKTDLSKCVETGANQITTYPLLLFPYTKLVREVKEGRLKIEERREEEIYREIIGFFSNTSYKQIAAWSFAKEGIERYGSVERENYLGLGASAISSFGSFTYANTFSIPEYIKTVEGGNLPIAFGSTFTQKQAMIQWFMLRLYELRVSKNEFKDRFSLDIEETLAPILRAMKLFGVLESKGPELVVKKPYLIHQLTKTFLLTYISRISEEGLKAPWPGEFKI
jgi:oxygen-independent coproporphyrinogen-3 oxidase